MTDQSSIDPERPDEPGFGERLRRILFGGGSIRELQRLVETDQLDDHYRVVFGRDDMHFRSIGRPHRHRAIVPTVRLLRVRLGYDDLIDSNEAQVVFTFTSAETVDENLRSLLEFVTQGEERSGPPGGDIGTGGPRAGGGAPSEPEPPLPRDDDPDGLVDQSETDPDGVRRPDDGEEGDTFGTDRRLAEDLLVDLARLDWLDRNEGHSFVDDLGWIDDAIDDRGRLDPEVRHGLERAVRVVVEILGGRTDHPESLAATRPPEVPDAVFGPAKGFLVGPIAAHIHALVGDPYTDRRRAHLTYVAGVLRHVINVRMNAIDHWPSGPTSEGDEESA